METERKLKGVPEGQPVPPLTRLKGLSPEGRDAVIAILQEKSYERARPKVEALVGFACSVDTLGRFFSWYKTRNELQGSADEVEQIDEFIKEWKPDWSYDDMVSPAAGFLMMLALKNRDTEAFSKVARVWLRKDKQALDKRKYDDSRKEHLTIAREELEAEFERKPEAGRLFREAKEALKGKKPEAGGQKAEGGQEQQSEVNDECRMTNGIDSGKEAGSPAPLQMERARLCEVLRGIGLKKASPQSPVLSPQSEDVSRDSHSSSVREQLAVETTALPGKVRKVAVYRQCKCFCTGCNSKTGVTAEEAGATSITTSSHIDIRGCFCICEPCQKAEGELWAKRMQSAKLKWRGMEEVSGTERVFATETQRTQSEV